MCQAREPLFSYEMLFEDEFKARLAEGWQVSTPDQMVQTVIHSAFIRLETVFAAWHSAPLPEVKRRMPVHEYLHQVLDKKQPIAPEVLFKAQAVAKGLGLVNLAEFLPKLPEHMAMCEQRIKRHYAPTV